MKKIFNNSYFFYVLFFLFQVSTLLSPAFATSVIKTSTIKYSIGSGFYYSSGNYNSGTASENNNKNQYDRKITLSAIPLVFKISRNLFSAKISTNYLYFTNQGNGQKDYQGLGNVYLSGKRLFPLTTFARFGDVQLKLKLPSANTNSDLGSKGLDSYISTSLYFKLKQNWVVTSFSYKHRSKKLNNTLSSSLSYSHLINQTLNTGVTFKYEQALQKSRQAIVESMLHLQWKQSKKTKIIFYFIQGHKDPVLKQAGGMQVNYNW